jgi:hypothetical protein
MKNKEDDEPHIENVIKLPLLELDLQLSPWNFFTLLLHPLAHEPSTIYTLPPYIKP